jgi:hypothetical protein
MFRETRNAREHQRRATPLVLSRPDAGRYAAQTGRQDPSVHR